MKGLGKIAVCLAGGLMLNISIHADDTVVPNNPYVPIAVRNVFGLNPPPTNAPTTTDDTPLKITPNGIMSILGQLQVLFKVAPKAGQPGAKEASYVLSEGQSQDEIEVTHIDEKAAIVTFNNHGTVQEIPLANAPALTTPMPAPSGAAPGQYIPTLPGGTVPNRLGGGRFGSSSGGRLGGQNNNINTGGNPAMSAVPTRNSGSTYGRQQQNSMSMEDHQLMVVAQHLKAQQEGSVTAPIFPPTPYDGAAGLQPMPGLPP
jgi:hypothetical protein